MTISRHLRVALAAALAGQAVATPADVQVRPAAGSEQAPLVVVGPEAAPAAVEGLPLVDSEKLQGLIKAENLMKRAEKLFEIATLSEEEHNRPTRVIGSDGHLGTLDYISSTIADLGDYYTLWNQSFNVNVWHFLESRLVVGNTVSRSYPMDMSPPTAHHEPVIADAILVAGDGCSSSDFPKDTKGKIAVIRRGTCAFGTKSQLAGQHGALAAIVYNTDIGSLRGTLGEPVDDHVPTFGMSGSEGHSLAAKLKKGESVSISAYVLATISKTPTTNILAQTKGGDPLNCVMAGAHSDSVGAGPGINDDGSGTLTLLEVATQLTKFQVNNCVRFAWWAAEEEGLLGSDHYVYTLPEEENQKIRLFMDYDMLASPNFAYQVYNATNARNPTGSEELRELYISWYNSQGLNYTLIPFDGRSDYDGFIRNGIPGGGIATGAEGVKSEEEAGMFGGKAGAWYDPCYHQLCDNVANLNVTAWELNSKLVAHSIATYALSLDDFPKRVKEVQTLKAESYVSDIKYHGDKLFI